MINQLSNNNSSFHFPSFRLSLSFSLQLKIMQAKKNVTPLRTIEIEAEEALVRDMKRIYEMNTFDMALVVEGMFHSRFLSLQKLFTVSSNEKEKKAEKGEKRERVKV
jgi:hypothetical protein